MKKCVALIAITFATSFMQAATETQSWWQRMSDTIAQHGGSRIKAAVVAAASKGMKAASAIPLPCSRRTKLTATTRRAGDVHYHSQTGRRKAQYTLLILGLGQIAIGMTPLPALLAVGTISGIYYSIQASSPQPAGYDTWLQVFSTESIGSGFLTMLPNGTPVIITNHHVINNTKTNLNSFEFHINTHNLALLDSIKVSLIAQDPSFDLAALEVTPEILSKGIRILPIAHIAPQKGDKIICIAPHHADIFEKNIRRIGRIKSATSELKYIDWAKSLIPTIRSTIYSSRGTSGAACINDNDEIIGVHFTSEGCNNQSCGTNSYQIPGAILSDFLSRIEQQHTEGICLSEEATLEANQQTINQLTKAEIQRLENSIRLHQKTNANSYSAKKIALALAKLKKRCPLHPAEIFYDEEPADLNKSPK